MYRSKHWYRPIVFSFATALLLTIWHIHPNQDKELKA